LTLAPIVEGRELPWLQSNADQQALARWRAASLGLFLHCDVLSQ
jgi:hypothetical protein